MLACKIIQKEVINKLYKFNGIQAIEDLQRHEDCNTIKYKSIGIIAIYFNDEMMKELTWRGRKDFIMFLDETGFLYGSNEENKEPNKKNRDSLSLDTHNCINSVHRLITCF
jgi:hypothetical protein